jgi:protoporphyrinogen oxidase
VYLKYFSRWKPLEKHTAYEWLKQTYGKRLFEVFFEPLLKGKFNKWYKDVTMAWFWARFKARSTSLGTFDGGFQAFIDKFTEILAKRGVEFRFNTMVDNITLLENDKIEIDSKGTKSTFDKVLATVSPIILTRIAPQLNGDYVQKIHSLQSIGAIVVILSLKNRLSREGYYWYNLPKSAGFPFLALVEHTNYISAENFNGEHLVYCGDYLNQSHEYFSLDKSELIDHFIPSFKKINPAFKKDWIARSWLFRTPFAQPIPFVNQSQRLLDIRTPLPGLFLASLSQVYPWDRGTNYAVALAHSAVQELLAP